MLQLLADRFLYDRGCWFDLATGRPVTICLKSAGPRRCQFEWSDRCAVLARLRHPLLNPLLDYGYAAAHVTFESYGLLPPLRAGAVAGSTAATHAVRFLRAHGVALTRELADAIVRPVQPGGRCGRPLGVVLQHRTILDTLGDVLDGCGTGPIAVRVAGPPRSGVRTLREAFARIARLAGYLPIGVESARRWPQLPAVTTGRHVCVMTDDESACDAATRACWLTRLGLESTRRHLHLSFGRCADGAPGALRLDPLGVAAMTKMIYVDPDFGPSAREILGAARAAEGWPGQFLHALHAEPFERWIPPGTATVHETSIPYVIEPAADRALAPPTRPRRLASALERAERRAVALAASGRHASAVRLLQRATRLLAARGAQQEAGRCALRLAWILRSRGDGQEAVVHVQRARTLTHDAVVHAAAAVALGVLWTDDGRYVEAEAALRGAAEAGRTLDHPPIVRQAQLGLARALLWQERTADALAALEGLSGPESPDVSCEAFALAARVHAQAGDVAATLGAASQALQWSRTVEHPRLEASARRAMATGLWLAGDHAGAAAHARAGLHAATIAHLPLTALRLRAIWLRALHARDPTDATARRLGSGLQKAAQRTQLPLVVRVQIEAACDARSQSSIVDGPARRPNATEIVAELVDAAQRAPDDAAALTSVLDAIVDRLQAASVVLVAGRDACRVMASSGRTWREGSAGARRALEAGLPVPVDRSNQPPEAAEPVRYAGHTIAAIACRWPAGASVDQSAVVLHLGAAAVALSPHVQAVLDTRDPPPAATWGDLLGESAATASLREAVQRAARAPFSVLIEGESGSGKELVARAIHRLGPRRDRRFCAINCAAITDELVEAELFGHARGAFTGAASERPGLFEEADGGTLFLDEVGELSARAQAKLLRVLQDGEVRRVGENFPRRVDVRVIAATNRRLEQEVEAARFRADLRFRLDVLRITVPALRDRVADIPVLATHFWQDASSRVGTRATLGPETLAALSRYDWPGNVRELQNAIAWIAVHAPRRGRIGAALLPSRLAAAVPLSTGSFEAAREDFERRFVRAALAQTGGHRARTAHVLGVSRQGLAKMLRRLGIDE